MIRVSTSTQVKVGRSEAVAALGAVSLTIIACAICIGCKLKPRIK